MPPFFFLRASDGPHKSFIPLRDLRSGQYSGNRSTMMLMMYRLESCSEENFLHEIGAWNVETKDTAGAMDEEKIVLQYE
jgi:hypothetical protein